MKSRSSIDMNLHVLRTRWHELQKNIMLGGRLEIQQRWTLMLGPLVLVFALIAPYRLLFLMAYIYLLLVIVCYAWVRYIGPRVSLQRRLQNDWAQVGDELEEQWELTNDALLPLLWLEIEDQSTLPGYTGRRVASAGAKTQNEWSTSAVCEQRGIYTLGPFTASLGDPLGLFHYRWHDEDIRKIVIYPPLVKLPPLYIPQGQRGGLARADLLQQNATPSVGGLREYTPGDLLSHIHWPTVAKTQRLMVKEFDQERAGALWIVLDLWAGAYTTPTVHHDTPRTAERELYGSAAIATQTSAISTSITMSTTESPLELAVVLVCSLAAQALSEGRAVGLMADDGRQRVLTPGRGPRQLWRIMSELVDVQATGTLPLGDLLRQGYTSRASEITGTSLVIVTPALDGAWLPALAVWLRGRPGGALALLVAENYQQAQTITSRLATSGIAAQIFERGTPLPLLNPPKPRMTLRVSPLGKVIREG